MDNEFRTQFVDHCKSKKVGFEATQIISRIDGLKEPKRENAFSVLLSVFENIDRRQGDVGNKLAERLSIQEMSKILTSDDFFTYVQGLNSLIDDKLSNLGVKEIELFDIAFKKSPLEHKMPYTTSVVKALKLLKIYPKEMINDAATSFNDAFQDLSVEKIRVFSKKLKFPEINQKPGRVAALKLLLEHFPETEWKDNFEPKIIALDSLNQRAKAGRYNIADVIPLLREALNKIPQENKLDFVDVIVKCIHKVMLTNVDTFPAPEIKALTTSFRQLPTEKLIPFAKTLINVFPKEPAIYSAKELINNLFRGFSTIPLDKIPLYSKEVVKLTKNAYLTSYDSSYVLPIINDAFLVLPEDSAEYLKKLEMVIDKCPSVSQEQTFDKPTLKEIFQTIELELKKLPIDDHQLYLQNLIEVISQPDIKNALSKETFIAVGNAVRMYSSDKDYLDEVTRTIKETILSERSKNCDPNISVSLINKTLPKKDPKSLALLPKIIAALKEDSERKAPSGSNALYYRSLEKLGVGLNELEPSTIPNFLSHLHSLLGDLKNEAEDQNANDVLQNLRNVYKQKQGDIFFEFAENVPTHFRNPLTRLEMLRIAGSIPTDKKLALENALTEEGLRYYKLIEIINKIGKTPAFLAKTGVNALLAHDNTIYPKITAVIGGTVTNLPDFLNFAYFVGEAHKNQLLNSSKVIEMMKLVSPAVLTALNDGLKTYQASTPDAQDFQNVISLGPLNEVLKSVKKVNTPTLEFSHEGMVHQIPKDYYLKSILEFKSEGKMPSEFPLFSHIVKGGPGREGHGFAYIVDSTDGPEVVAICTDLKKTLAYIVEQKKFDLSVIADDLSQMSTNIKNKLMREELKEIVNKISWLNTTKMTAELYGTPVLEREFSDVLKLINDSKLDEKIKTKVMDRVKDLSRKVTAEDMFSHVMSKVSTGGIHQNTVSEIISLGNMSHKKVLEQDASAKYLVRGARKLK